MTPAAGIDEGVVTVPVDEVTGFTREIRWTRNKLDGQRRPAHDTSRAAKVLGFTRRLCFEMA